MRHCCPSPGPVLCARLGDNWFMYARWRYEVHRTPCTPAMLESCRLGSAPLSYYHISSSEILCIPGWLQLVPTGPEALRIHILGRLLLPCVGLQPAQPSPPPLFDSPSCTLGCFFRHACGCVDCAPVVLLAPSSRFPTFVGPVTMPLSLPVPRSTAGAGRCRCRCRRRHRNMMQPSLLSACKPWTPWRDPVPSLSIVAHPRATTYRSRGAPKICVVVQCCAEPRVAGPHEAAQPFTPLDAHLVLLAR